MRGQEDGITRRQLLVGGAAALGLLAAGGVVGSRSWRVRSAYYELTGAYGPPGAFPERQDVTYVYDTMPSRILRRDVEYGIAWPPGVPLPGHGRKAQGLPLVFALPGRGRAPRELLAGGLRLGDFAAAPIVAGDSPPFAVACVDGGDTYWHRRSSGLDSMAMLLREFIPFCERRYGAGAHGRRAIMGWSMGGYGTLRAAELRPGMFRGVCAASPALWTSFAAGVGDAFDNAADYAANDVYAGAARLVTLDPALGGVRLRLDCGEQDPFYEADKAFVASLPFTPAGGFTPGGHDDRYWRRVAPAEIEFIWRALFARFGGD